MDEHELVNKRVHAIAQAHRCTVANVHSALDRHPIELDRDAFLKRTLALELVKLAISWSRPSSARRCVTARMPSRSTRHGSIRCV